VINVLDIDLDLFVEPRTDGSSQRDQSGRVTDSHAWSREAIAVYVDALLATSAPVPRWSFFDTHDEVMEVLAGLPEPCRLFHLDAHADLGIGEPLHEFHADFLMLPLESRREKLLRCRLTEGNFLLYAIAAGLVVELHYVTHPDVLYRQPDIDIPIGMDWWEKKPEVGQIQIRRYSTREEAERPLERPTVLELAIPLRMYSRDHFSSPRVSFDYVLVIRSPRYTPPSIDPVFEYLRVREASQ
jgi:hypothetical protein